MLSRKYAAEQVRRYVTALEDLPPGYRLIDRRGDHQSQERCFDVQQTVLTHGREKPREFLVLQLRIDSQSSIRIVSDRREYVKELLSSARHVAVDYQFSYEFAEAYNLFMSYAVNAVSVSMAPEWVQGIEEADEKHRQYGIDAWVHFHNLKGDLKKAPIKVFVSLATKSRYFNKRMPKEIAKTVAVLLKPSYSEEVTMRNFYETLTNKRNNGAY